MSVFTGAVHAPVLFMLPTRIGGKLPSLGGNRRRVFLSEKAAPVLLRGYCVFTAVLCNAVCEPALIVLDGTKGFVQI